MSSMFARRALLTIAIVAVAGGSLGVYLFLTRKQADVTGIAVKRFPGVHVSTLTFNGKNVLGKPIVKLRVKEQLAISADWTLSEAVEAQSRGGSVLFQFQDEHDVVFSSAAANAEVRDGEGHIQNSDLITPVVPGKYYFTMSIPKVVDPATQETEFSYMAKLVVVVE